MPKPRVQPCIQGRRAGSFPEQRLVIEPTFLAANFVYVANVMSMKD